MHITLISPYARSLVRVRGALLQGLIDKGHIVSAIVSEWDDEACRHLDRLGVEVVRVAFERGSLNPFTDLRACRDLAMTLQKLRSDVTLHYTIKPVIYGSFIAHMLGIKCLSVITGVGYIYAGDGTRQRILRPVVDLLYRRALPLNQTVFFLNEDDMTLFHERGLLSECKNVQLINGEGVDLDEFYLAPPVMDEIRFLFIGRLIRDKGIMELVQAAQELKMRYPAAKVQVLGRLDQHNPTSLTQAELDHLARSGSIEYLGETTDVRPFLAQASVLVLPSYREGKPRVIMEAMAMGRPIITTDAPGCRHMVQAGTNGMLVRPRDPKHLLEAMIKFIEEPRLIASMGLASRQLAEALYDVHRINEVIIRQIEAC